MPGVTLVSSTNDQVTGQRKPSTMAIASSRWTLPMNSSMAKTGMASRASAHGPVIQMYSVAPVRNHRVAKTGHGMAVQRVMRGTNTGE